MFYLYISFFLAFLAWTIIDIVRSSGEEIESDDDFYLMQLPEDEPGNGELFGENPAL